MKNDLPNLGIGLGFRLPHYTDIVRDTPELGFFEIISENFMVDGGAPLSKLERLLENYRIVQHGVSLSIASADPLDFDYLSKLKKLADMTNTPWVSDHLCWSRAHSHWFHDLLPLPYTAENARFISDKARIVHDFLERPFALENLSTYLTFKESTMSEWEFYAQIIEQADIYMMLDINNVYVSACNHNFDALEYLDHLPMERLCQVHLAGHSQLENGLLLDTHDQPVCDEVWKLYAHIYKKSAGVSTLLEWDDNFLSFEETLAEARKALNFQVKLCQ